jgi:glycogen operon protein
MTGWLDWSQLQANRDIFRFFQRMIAFRKSHPSLCRSRFWRGCRWYGTGGKFACPMTLTCLAFCLHGASQEMTTSRHDQRLLGEVGVSCSGRSGAGVDEIVDTALPSPDDFPDRGEPLGHRAINEVAQSLVVLLRKDSARQPPGRRRCICTEMVREGDEWTSGSLLSEVGLEVYPRARARVHAG